MTALFPLRFTLRSGLALLALLLGGAGCGDDGDDKAGTGGTGGAGTCGGADTSGCTVVVSPSADDTTKLKEALIGVTSGGTVCLCPGTYKPTAQLSLNVKDVTVRGLGAGIEDTVLDYAGQTQDSNSFLVTSDGFTVENIWLKNSPGNGIVVQGAEDVTFRKLKVSWDAGSVTANGAYAVYPVSSKRVLVEDSEVVGAADAGIYVGQCEQAIVRRNKVYGNVAGIEIENSLDAEVYENEAYDNTAGILVFTLPNLQLKDGARALVRDNLVKDNNRENFAEEGTIVSYVPPGTGMMVLSSDRTEIRDNTIEGNVSAGILVLSGKTVDIILPSTPDPGTDPYPEGTYIHSNTFTNNGTAPEGILATLGLASLENVLWDGYVSPAASLGNPLCLGTAPLPTFRNFAVPEGGLADVSKHTTDATAHECTLEALPAVSW